MFDRDPSDFPRAIETFLHHPTPFPADPGEEERREVFKPIPSPTCRPC
jgi:hypothetical protein